ncbi:MAG: hypothetical protein AAFV98_22535, partial [Chloroflexota bacterium]
ESTIEGETVLFTREESDAQIYVRVVDTINSIEAIDAAIADLGLTLEVTEPDVEGRIGRLDGTWFYRIFRDGTTSITAYALLQSDENYVVLFAEESPDYDAVHFPVRNTVSDPTPDDVPVIINEASQNTLQALIDETYDTEPLSTRNPAEDNILWVEATYPDDITTVSYLFAPQGENIVYITLVEGDATDAAILSDAFDSVFLGFVITPNNIEYLYLGLGISATIMLVLIASIWLRFQNARKDLALVEQLAEDENA